MDSYKIDQSALGLIITMILAVLGKTYMNPSETPLPLIGLCCILVGILFVYSFLKDFNRSRKLLDTAKSKIKSAPKGLVKLEGYAWPYGQPLEDIHGKHVVYYNYRIEKNDDKIPYMFRHNQPFYLVNESGVCLIRPAQDNSAHENVILEETKTKLPAYVESIPQLQTVLKNNKLRIPFLSGNYQIVEQKIYAGSPVSVIGELQHFPISENLIIGDYKKFLEAAKKDKSRNVIENNYIKWRIANKSNSKECIPISGIIESTASHEIILSNSDLKQLIHSIKKRQVFEILAAIILFCTGVALLTFD